ncbi:MAG: hypothetical protein IT233_04470 [Bacteroidia bacterium]|nr:hypothetical protein [Bacteroidia bacterium]
MKQHASHLILVAEPDAREASRLIEMMRASQPHCLIKHLRNGIELSEFFMGSDLSHVCLLLLNLALPKCQICELIRSGRSALPNGTPVIGYAPAPIEISHPALLTAGVSKVLESPIQKETLYDALGIRCHTVK